MSMILEGEDACIRKAHEASKQTVPSITCFHASRSSHLIHADAYSSKSAASAFRCCFSSCFASNSPLSFLHSSTRFTYSSLFPNLSNESSSTLSREQSAFSTVCCPIKCAFAGSQSCTKFLYSSLCAILFRSLAFSSPLTYLSSLKNRQAQAYLYMDSTLSKGRL